MIKTSKAYVRSLESRYVRDRTALLDTLKHLDVILDYNMSVEMEVHSGKTRWCLQVRCEVNDENK